MDCWLTIAIPTVEGREAVFRTLHDFLMQQIARDKLEDRVELIHLRDNKQISIGAKRQKLFEMARGKYCVQIDDDDTVAADYVRTLKEHIAAFPRADAFGYIEHCDIDGQIALCHHSDRWPDWGDSAVVNGHVFRYVRTPFFKDPIRTEICRTVGVNDLRYGEDHDFARRLKASKLIRTCIEIPKIMYYYRYRHEPLGPKFGATPRDGR